ncbi:uncharacterized protein LOC111281502 [Durio zibethinus]|uniref:Uncharacterized protein LOC111281502 n=1 Tax=Durio zibethinus TaxID=66656 RepID=A0A6P5XB04_DURZI|nr:uncharacterized protein LOC111281502 [Durio zibethinus]
MPYPELMQPAYVLISAVNTELVTRIRESWLKDPALIHLLHKIKSDPTQFPKYSWQAGQLERKGKLMLGVNAELRRNLLQYFQGSAVGGHSGMESTIRRLASVVYWKGLY